MTLAVDRFAVAVRGQARKRGLIPRLPTPERLLADVEAWLRREYPDELLDATVTGDATVFGGATGDATAIHARLHPAAPPLRHRGYRRRRRSERRDHRRRTRISAVRRSGARSPLQGAELGIDWADRASDIAFADRPAVERAYLGWLGPELMQARNRVQRGARGVHVGMPAGTTVTCDAAIATVLGRRNEAWLDAAIADPRIAIGITPWW